MSEETKGTALVAGARPLAIVPRSIEEAFRLASGIAKSGLAPKGMNTPEQVMVAIMTGLEVGLPPMFAVQKIAVINGRPSIWGDAVPGLLWSRGFQLEETISGDADNRTAVCTVTRPTGIEIQRTFSVADARKAGLWGKSGPWQQYPDRMLAMRARGFAARDGAADVLGGLYLSEELEEAPRDITPASAPLEIPSIPDVPEISSTPAETVSDPLADEAGFLASFEEEMRAVANDAALRQETWDANEHMLERLSADGAAKMGRLRPMSEAAE